MLIRKHYTQLGKKIFNLNTCKRQVIALIKKVTLARSSKVYLLIKKIQVFNKVPP